MIDQGQLCMQAKQAQKKAQAVVQPPAKGVLQGSTPTKAKQKTLSGGACWLS